MWHVSAQFRQGVGLYFVVTIILSPVGTSLHVIHLLETHGGIYSCYPSRGLDLFKIQGFIMHQARTEQTMCLICRMQSTRVQSEAMNTSVLWAVYDNPALDGDTGCIYLRDMLYLTCFITICLYSPLVPAPLRSALFLLQQTLFS